VINGVYIEMQMLYIVNIGLAQLVERRTFNPVVEGSSPSSDVFALFYFFAKCLYSTLYIEVQKSIDVDVCSRSSVG
jgi:nitrate reductase gamma subunit